MPGKPTYFFKMVLIGDSSVGKTSLLKRFTSAEFEHNAAPTVGVDYATRQVETHDHQTIEAQVWDTGGQERHHSAITASFYRSVVGALVVFDLTNRASFEHCQRWLKVLRSHRGHGEPHQPVVAMLVGNKSDLRKRREVDFQDAADFAEDNNLAYIECSAADASNVDIAFETVVLEVYRKVRKNIEAGKCNPDRPSPGLLNTVLVTPAQLAREEMASSSGCC
mmetsp:Transcript_30146/g.97241  ORF Transcript_30146/g.97241 Transcript_30146/m.97241 type:complete len:222 (+) Transcript_30146:34-699(+)